MLRGSPNCVLLLMLDASYLKFVAKKEDYWFFYTFSESFTNSYFLKFNNLT